MKKEMNLKTWIIWTLRKASYRWPPRQKALKEAEVAKSVFLKNSGVKPSSLSKMVRKFYRCVLCKYVFSRKQVSVDHISPVVNPKKGWEGWETYIKRLFCPVEGFQVICSECHDSKTAAERKIRMKYKKIAKAA